MEGNQLLHHAIPELTGAVCMDFFEILLKKFEEESEKNRKKLSIQDEGHTCMHVCG